MILEISIKDNENEELKKLELLVENIKKEFSSIKYLDTSSIKNKLSSDSYTVYSYYLKNSGLIRIFVSAIFTFISILLIFIFISFITIFNTNYFNHRFAL